MCVISEKQNNNINYNKGMKLNFYPFIVTI